MDATLSEEPQERAPSFVPRSYTPTPEIFGENATVRFIPLGPGRQHRIWAEASRQQHLFVVAVRLQLGGPRTMRALAERTGINYYRLSRLLRGHLPMRLTEMASIAHTLRLEATWHNRERP